MANVEGAVDVRNSFGAVTVSRAKKGAKVNSGNGGVSLSDVGAACFVKTSFALVEALAHRGRPHGRELERSRAGLRRAGAIDVRTSFSPVALDRRRGAVDVDNQNGSSRCAT